MRQINATVKPVIKVVKNPEGGILWKENTDRNLFSVASAFKLKNSFYWNEKEILSALESAIDAEPDLEYKAGLAIFLSEFLGIRLSPVLMLTRLSWSPPELSLKDKEVIANAVALIMDRPDKIANALAYAQYKTGNAKHLAPYFKRALKKSFESFDAYTLKKFKLKRRMVKTSDVIKMLHPKPRTASLSRLYKAIIENSNESAIERGAVITQVLSDNSLAVREKRDWVSSNLDKIPLNALIRNMANIEDTFENLTTLENRLTKALRTYKGIPVVKVFNPFDLIQAIENVTPAKRNILFRVLERFVDNITLGVEGKKVTFLVDVSGSMRYSGLEIVRKYFSILVPSLARHNRVSFYKFNTKVTKVNPNFEASVQGIYSGFGRNFIADGGTALVDAVRTVIAEDNPDLLVVFSDEITWADRSADMIFDVGVPVIAINPKPYSQGSAFNPNKPIVKLSAIDGKILYYIPLLANFNNLRNWIKSMV